MNICAVSPKQVIFAIEKEDYKTFSFDIFNTLLKQNVPISKKGLLLLEKYYQRKFGSDRKISRLCGEAEKRVVQQTDRKDVNL